MLALSGTAAGAQRAQIRPTRVKEGGSDTAKRCFRGPHELAFIPSKIFLFTRSLPQVQVGRGPYTALFTRARNGHLYQLLLSF